MKLKIKTKSGQRKNGRFNDEDQENEIENLDEVMQNKMMKNISR
jgi:hypothetical protein